MHVDENVDAARTVSLTSLLLVAGLQFTAPAYAQASADADTGRQPDSAPIEAATPATPDSATAAVAESPTDAPPPDVPPADGAQPYAEVIAIDQSPGSEPKAAPPSTPKSANRFMEEVVVTAQKREENLQDVPISVTALSGEMLEAKGIDDPTKLADVSPGLTYNSQVGFAIIYIRGVGSDAFLTADPSVASYIDGIYYPFSSGLAQSFGKVERVEVLKGPQGTLFGRNSTGGAISITTETPSKTFGGSIESGYSSFNTWKTNALVSGPIGDSFAASVALMYNRSDNYYHYDEQSIQQYLPTETARAARVKLRWFPTDDLDVTLGYTKIKQGGVNTVLSPNTAPSPLAALLGSKAQPRDYSAEVDTPVDFTIDSEVYTGQGKLTFGGVDIKLLGSHQHIANVGHTDFDGTNVPIATFSADPLYSTVNTGELQFLSNSDSWGSKWLESIGGFYYFDSAAGLKPRLTLLGGNAGNVQLGLLPPVPLGQLVSLLPPVLQNALGPLPLTHGVIVRLEGQVDTKSYAGYAQTTAHATDWLAITLGARYQQERREAVDSKFGLENGDGSVTQVFDFIHNPLFQQVPLTTHTSFFSPKVTINITPVDGTLLYASWQRANKSGTYNIINIYNGVDYAKPEVVTAVELGIKSEFLGGLARFNAALFQSRIKDLQVQFVSLLNGGAVSIENAPGARSRGAEFDTLLQLFPSVIDGLVFTVAGAYVDAIYTDYPQGSGFNEKTGIFEQGQDFTGNRIVRTPKVSGNAVLSKTTAFDWGSLEVAGDVSYNSGYYYLAQNTLFNQDKYYLFNARVSALYDPWNLRLTVFGDNLGNAIHDLSQFPNDFGRLEALGPPRTFGMRVDWAF